MQQFQENKKVGNLSEYLKELFTCGTGSQTTFSANKVGVLLCVFSWMISIESGPHPIHKFSRNDGTHVTPKALKDVNFFHLALELESGLETPLKFLFFLG
jgi:hypothetical protein